jgi:hypothetical protein
MPPGGGETLAPANRNSERRLGDLLVAALILACAQRDIDAARGIDQVLEQVLRRQPARSATESRRGWPAKITEAQAALHALEHAIRKSGPSRR